MSYTLLQDGDDFEKHYWNVFIRSDFPSYEKYWSAHVTPLTNRPTDIHFKKSTELIAEGYTDEDVCKAQLHYTILRHLVRTYEILIILKNEQQTIGHTDYLSEGLFHLTAAQDVAFEFLQRNVTPNKYDAWTAKKSLSPIKAEGSDEARREWQKNNGYPLQDIRNYRNHLTHGRMLPQIPKNGKVFLPGISQENNYLDWRIVTDGLSLIPADFCSLDNILSNAWSITLPYLESEWQKL